ncbi:hypothetical protein [Tautonia marina]|uniref:hypothetical protein n=1 Tax=Tautonia marina TaxID=2653855 RepID=UPI001260F1C6|nr:hypothetical protein [Tautonia marina]
MRVYRFRLSGLMLIVAVVALNLAIGMALFSRDISLLFRIALIGIALQVGLVAWVRGRNRPFWAGFMAFGLLSALSCALAFGPRFEIVTDATGSRPVEVAPASAMWQAWEGYDRLWVSRLEPVVFPYLQLPEPPLPIVIAWVTTIILASAVPHALIAIAGGLITRASARRFRSRVGS